MCLYHVSPRYEVRDWRSIKSQLVNHLHTLRQVLSGDFDFLQFPIRSFLHLLAFISRGSRFAAVDWTEPMFRPVQVSVGLPLYTYSRGAGLTPSLPQPVKFPGWKIHGHICKQYIFRICNTLLSMLCVLLKFLSYARAKNKTKKLKGFQFRTFIGHFQGTTWQWRG